MIQMLAKENLWVPGRINYYSRSSIIPVSGGTVGSTISQCFANYNPTLGTNITLLNMHDIRGKSVIAIGSIPMPTTDIYGIVTDRGISSRQYTSSSSYINFFEVKEISGKSVAIIGDVPLPSTANAYGLLVERGILTERVRVAIKGSAAWADYVFADDYKLMPLKQLESYIQTENHLPDVPNTAEVLKDGVDLGEMQAKLLQKVEELTLYVIQQQKEIDNLKQVGKSKIDGL